MSYLLGPLELGSEYPDKLSHATTITCDGGYVYRKGTVE